MGARDDPVRVERRALRLSVFGYLFMAVLGVTFAVLGQRSHAPQGARVVTR